MNNLRSRRILWAYKKLKIKKILFTLQVKGSGFLYFLSGPIFFHRVLSVFFSASHP